MHETSCVHLSHGCVDNGKPSLPALPCIKVMFVVVPLDGVEFLLERFSFQHFGEMVRNVCVELSPMDLADDVILDPQHI